MSKNFFEWFWNHKKTFLFLTIGFWFSFTLFVQVVEKIQTSEPKIHVEVTQPVFKEMIEQISATGNIEAEKQTTLASKIPGKIKSILTKEGDQVGKDQLLVQLEATESKLRESIAESAHRSQASAIDEENYKRHKKLLEEGVITQSEFDKIESEYVSAQAEKERLQKTVELQKEEVSSTEIKAPFDSLTAKVFVHEGEVVASGTPLAMLVTLDVVHVKVSVAAKHINRIQKGMTASVKAEGTQKTFQGMVEYLSPVADPLSRTFDVTIKINNHNRLLKPGMFAKTTIIVEQHPKALTLPKTVLVKKEDLTGHWIYVIENKRASLKQIKTGLETANDIEILTALDPKTMVVTAGQNELYDKAPVVIAP